VGRSIQLGQRAQQRVAREALQRRIERRAHLRAGRGPDLGRDPPREVRGERGAVVAHAVGRAREHELHVAVERRAGLAGLHVAQDPARAFGDLRRRGVRRAHQRGRDRGFARVEAGRRLAEQHLRQRGEPHRLAPERHEIQVRLEDLILAPAAFEQQCVHRLRRLLRQRALPRAARRIAEQPGQLHRHGRRATGALVPQVAPGRAAIPRQSTPLCA
jgi:hypothetical protein